MLKLLKNEWRKIWIPFVITLFLSIVAVWMMTSLIYKSYSLNTQLDVHQVGFEIVILFIPLLAVIPTAWLMYFERKTNFIRYTVPRVKLHTYILTKAIVSMVSGFVIIFGISIISVIIALDVVPPIEPNPFIGTNSLGEPILPQDLYIFGEVYVNHPFLYGAILSIWKGILSSLIALFGFALSLYSRNLFVILAGPFIYMILDVYVWGLIGPMKYNFVTALEPSKINNDYFTWLHFMLPPIQLCVVIISYVLYMHFKVKKSVYEL